ncbi:MAG: BMC domain-containing protein [Thermoflexales bacterium]|nr:BMC domain-containing protein [Thermoflexales bacterium]
MKRTSRTRSTSAGSTALAAVEPALALIEFDSIAAGIQAGDAMVKKAPIARVVAGTVQPGHYLVLISGEVADVDESLKAGREVGGAHIVDTVFLPHVHPAVVNAIAGGRDVRAGAALGVIETATVPAAIRSADAGVKGAQVALLEIRLADGLHGKGLTFFTGEVADVEAAIEIGLGAIEPHTVINQVVIAQLHPEMNANVQQRTRFGSNLGANWPLAHDE